MTSLVPPIMIGLKPSPRTKKNKVIFSVPVPASSRDSATMATVVTVSPSTTGVRGPQRLIQNAVGGAPTIISRVSPSTWMPDRAGVRPSTFWR